MAARTIQQSRAESPTVADAPADWVHNGAVTKPPPSREVGAFDDCVAAKKDSKPHGRRPVFEKPDTNSCGIIRAF